jgi:putative flippase GtrA
LWTLVRYALVGGINTATGLGVMAALAWAGVHYALYTLAGYVVAFVTSYLLNAWFTFRVEDVSTRNFALFALVNGALILLVQAVQAGLIELAGVPVLAGVACGAVVYTLTGFALNRRIVYRVA